MLSCVPSTTENNRQMGENLDVFYRSPLPCWLVSSKDLKILAASRQAENIYQYSQDEWKQLSFYTLFAQSVHKQLLDFLHQPAAEGKAFMLNKKDGEQFPGKLYSIATTFNGQNAWQITIVHNTFGNSSTQTDLANSICRQNIYLTHSSECTWCYELEVPLPVESSIVQMVDHIKKHAFLIECNHNTVRLLGRKFPSEILGSRLSSLIDMDQPEIADLVRAFTQNNFQVSNAEVELRSLNNESLYITGNFIGIVEEGCLSRIWGTHFDITAKKELEKEARLLACLIDGTFDVLAATDLEWNQVSWNSRCEKLFGITAEQVIGKTIREFIPELNYHNTTRDQVRSHITKTGAWQGEISFTRPADMKTITLLAHFKQLKNEKGEPTGYAFSGTDVTGKLESELQLKETENRFVKVADAAPVIIWMSDSENKIIYVNKTGLDFNGLDETSIKNFNWQQFIHPEDLERIEQEYRAQLAKMLPVCAVYRILHKSGEYRWIKETAKPRILEDGTYMGYIGSIIDVHEQKIKEDQLRYQATMLENISDIIITSDLNHNVLFWNSAAEEAFGVAAADIQGKFLYEYIHFDFGMPPETVLEEFTANGVWKGEVAITNKNGEKRYILFTTSYLIDSQGNKFAIMGVGRDITELRQAGAKLMASEQFYRNLIADSGNGILIAEVDGTTKYASLAVQTILGYDPDELIGKNCFDYIHPEDLRSATESFQLEVEEHPVVKSIEVRVRHKSGEWLWCLVRGHNLLNNEYIQGIVIYFHDHTLRKKANDALRESEQRFRTLIRDIQVGVMLLDAKANILLVNKAIQEMFMITEKEVLIKNLFSFVIDVINEKGEKLAVEDCPVPFAIKNKTQVNDVVMGVYRPKTNDRVWIMMNADPMFDEEGNVTQVICSIKDISERKKLEAKLLAEQINHQKQLTQATIDAQERERREIGKELHDNFGQQLTTIKLFLEMAKSTADDATNEMISMGLKGVSDVINGMRQMSRNIMPPTLGDLGLIDSIFDLIESINRTQAINIEFDFFEFNEAYLSDNKQLMAFRIIQEQLNNIIKHAQASNVSIKLYNNEDEAFLEIIDDGKGFDLKTAKRGLGLTNIKNRAEIFSGTVTITTSPGNGCHLKVYVPNLQEEQIH